MRCKQWFSGSNGIIQPKLSSRPDRYGAWVNYCITLVVSGRLTAEAMRIMLGEEYFIQP
jgi:hypothetical protein